MTDHKVKRYVFSFITSVSFGLLLAWVFAFERDNSKQFLASFSIIALLLFFHLLSSRILNRSILIMYSYIEGILFFTIAVTVFRIGDHFLGITNLSLMFEFLLIFLGVISGSAYVWTIRQAYKDQMGKKK